jgi:hypothetical protein
MLQVGYSGGPPTGYLKLFDSINCPDPDGAIDETLLIPSDTEIGNETAGDIALGLDQDAVVFRRALTMSSVTLCWARFPTDIWDFEVTIGSLSINGPRYQDSTCMLGESCYISLVGSGLLSSDTMFMAASCSDNQTTAQMFAKVGNEYFISADMLPLKAPQSTLTNHLCWFQADETNSSIVTVGTVMLLGPHSLTEESAPEPCASLPVCVRGLRTEPCAFVVEIGGFGLPSTNLIRIIDASIGCGVAANLTSTDYVERVPQNASIKDKKKASSFCPADIGVAMVGSTLNPQTSQRWFVPGIEHAGLHVVCWCAGWAGNCTEDEDFKELCRTITKQWFKLEIKPQ